MCLCLWLLLVAPGHKGITLIHRWAMKIISFWNISRCYCRMMALACSARASQGKVTMRYTEEWSTQRQYILQKLLFLSKTAFKFRFIRGSSLTGPRCRIILDQQGVQLFAAVPRERQRHFMFTNAFIVHLFVLFYRMYLISIKWQDDTPSYLYFCTVFFKFIENS